MEFFDPSLTLKSFSPIDPSRSELKQIKVLCEQTRELTHDFLDYV